MKVKRAGVGTKLLVLVLLVAAVMGVMSVRAQLDEANARRDQLQSQVQAGEERNSALQDAIDHSTDPDYIADIARSELDLLESDEIRFVDTSN